MGLSKFDRTRGTSKKRYFFKNKNKPNKYKMCVNCKERRKGRYHHLLCNTCWNTPKILESYKRGEDI